MVVVNPNSRSTRTVQRAWVGATLAYGALRVALAGAFLADYGVNIVVFAVIELTSSYVFGAASGRLVDEVIRGCRGSRIRLGLITLAGYSAPDAYVIVHAHRFPEGLRNTVLGIVTGTTIVSTAVLVRRIRAERNQGAQEGSKATDTGDSPAKSGAGS